MNTLCVYDIQSVNWGQVNSILKSMEYNGAFDWNSGEVFPWWVWLANTGATQEMVGQGVFDVHAIVSARYRAICVTTTNGTFHITGNSRHGTMTINDIGSV
jgi:hypothetical protein